MADTMDYTVTNYVESMDTVFSASGVLRKVKRVRFMIGNNGPYSLTFEAREDNPDNIAAKINAQVAALRATYSKLNQGM